MKRVILETTKCEKTVNIEDIDEKKFYAAVSKDPKRLFLFSKIAFKYSDRKQIHVWVAIDILKPSDITHLQDHHYHLKKCVLDVNKNVQGCVVYEFDRFYDLCDWLSNTPPRSTI